MKIEQNDAETLTGVDDYIRTVPRRYTKGPISVYIVPDSKGEALVNLRGRDYRIIVQKKPRTSLKKKNTLGKVRDTLTNLWRSP